MAITSRDGWFAAAKQRALYYKTAARTTVAGGWFSVFDVAGNPGAGTLAIGNTANGVVPTNAVAGYPIINAFGASATGYVGRVSFANTVASRVKLYDRVWASGAHAFNASQAISSAPSYVGRIPAASYNGLELWVEQVTAATLNQAVNVTYTNQAGVTSRTTGAVGIGAAPTVGRCWPLSLQAGDSGVQSIQNIAGTVASAGTFNVMVLRPLASGFIKATSLEPDVQEVMKAMMRPVYADSAVYPIVMSPVGTSSGVLDIEIDIVNG